MQKARSLIKAGTKNPEIVISQMQIVLNQASSISIEYIDIVDAVTLQKLTTIADKTLVAIAVKLSTTRLIDNIVVGAS